MCSKFKEANDFPKWQESGGNENLKNHEFEKENNKTTALSSLRTAQSGKSETRQNEKRYYKSKKVLSVSRQIQRSKFDVDFIDLNLLHKGSY